MIRVFADGLHAGALEKSPHKPHYVFTYDPEAPQERSVSLTMPVRLQSYLSPPAHLHPIFDMNLPEGYLRSWLMKTIPDCDDLSLLQVTGSSQVGRLEYSSQKRFPEGSLPDFNVQDILTYDGAEDLFQDLLHMYGRFSGVSGVQPKVMIRDPVHTKMSPDHKLAVRAATHIVKTWDAQYPQLAFNEHFCLQAAVRAGLKTPSWETSQNGKFLIVERFDLTDQNRYLGLEDFCVLAGLPTAHKYKGSYEQLVKTLKSFSARGQLSQSLVELFKLIALNVGLRNGDAHRKNFCLIYDSPVARRGVLAPAFDLVTTTAYLPNDAMALTMNGSKRWPRRQELLGFARDHCGLQPKQALRALDEVRQGIQAAEKDLLEGIRHLEGFSVVGQRMHAAWREGVLQL